MKLIATFLLTAVVCQSVEAASIIGDRRPAIHCVYPDDLMFHSNQGGLVFDVTQSPYNLKGDGETDCTDGLIQLYDDILARLETGGGGWGNPGPDYTISPIIYFPRGTYLVSDTIIYSGKERAGWNLVPEAMQRELGRNPSKHGAWDTLRGGVPGLDYSKISKTGVKNYWEHVARIRFIGEERGGTIIKLQDCAQGFGEGARKPILSFGKSHFNNHVAKNAVRNLTIDSGTGNPGAVAIHLNGANTVDISNVTIQSGDGSGASGIDVLIPPTQGYHSNITINGFDCGIYLGGYHVTHPVFEYVTLKNQRKTGIYVASSSTSVRGLKSINEVPALTVDSSAGQAILIDSRLIGGASDAAAIVVNCGSAVLRNIDTDGYREPIAGKRGARIEEVIVGERIPNGERTLDLPIEEVPLLLWEDNLDQWANAKDFGAVGDDATDDTAAIQRAMDSGKRVIYFPSGKYRTKGVVTVPASVKRIDGLFHPVHMKLNVNEASDEPLLVVDAVHPHVEVTAKRMVILSRLVFTGVTSKATVFRPKFHVLGSSACGIKNAENMDIWCRFINPEGHFLPLTAGEGTKLWIMGFKTERGGSDKVNQHDLKVVEGGKLEVLGGVSGVAPKGILINENGDVSLTCVMSSNGYLQKNDVDVIVERLPSEEKIYRAADLPPRTPDRSHPPQPCIKAGEVMIPLYRMRPE